MKNKHNPIIKISAYNKNLNSVLFDSPIFRFSLFLSILLILSVGLVYWYFPQRGMVTAGGTDLMFHANRFYAIIQSIEYGTFPFYINADALNQYGYAANLFYPDVMLVPFALLAPYIGFASAYKLMIFVYTFLCGIFSYWCFNRITKGYLMSCLFALLYTFALYRIIDISYRGALGEFISFSFLPIVFVGISEILFGNYKQKWYIISIGFICLVYTHLLSTLLIFICVCVALIICYKQIKKEPMRLVYLFLAGAVSCIASIAFLLPMFEQLSGRSFYFQTHPLATEIGTQSVELRRVLWGIFNGLTDNKLRVESIGIILIIPLFFRIAIKGKHPFLKFADICAVISLILIFALSDIFPWYTFPFNQLTILQFPFRLLQPASFLLACSGAIYLSIIAKDTNRNLIILFCVSLLIGYSIRLTGGVYQGYAKYKINNNTGHNLDQLEVVGAEYLSSRIPSTPTEDIRYRIQYILDRKGIIESDPQILIKNQRRDKNKFIFRTEQNSEANIVLPLLFYKGYEAINSNGVRLSVKESNTGLIEIKSHESAQITVWYNGTAIQKISLVISCLSLLLLLVFVIYQRKRI